MFDIKTYFEDHMIHYDEEGDNVTEGWVNIQCIFCSDSANHLGINIESGNYHCWKCGTSGNIWSLLKEIENCSFKKIKMIYGKYQTENYFPKNKEQTKKDIQKILPKEATKEFQNVHLNYLRKRRYIPEYVIQKYDLYATKMFGDYRFRIIFPFFYNKKIITFSSVDVTGKSRNKYKHASKENSIIDPKNALYNVDNCFDSVVLVEGVFDCWRIGDGAIALMGTKYTQKQIEQLIELQFKKILVMFDSDAIKFSHSLANQLSPFADVEVIEIERGDPDDLPNKYVQQVRKWIK